MFCVVCGECLDVPEDVIGPVFCSDTYCLEWCYEDSNFNPLCLLREDTERTTLVISTATSQTSSGGVTFADNCESETSDESIDERTALWNWQGTFEGDVCNLVSCVTILVNPILFSPVYGGLTEGLISDSEKSIFINNSGSRRYLTIDGISPLLSPFQPPGIFETAMSSLLQLLSAILRRLHSIDRGINKCHTEKRHDHEITYLVIAAPGRGELHRRELDDTGHWIVTVKHEFFEPQGLEEIRSERMALLKWIEDEEAPEETLFYRLSSFLSGGDNLKTMEKIRPSIYSALPDSWTQFCPDWWMSQKRMKRSYPSPVKAKRMRRTYSLDLSDFDASISGLGNFFSELEAFAKATISHSLGFVNEMNCGAEVLLGEEQIMLQEVEIRLKELSVLQPPFRVGQVDQCFVVQEPARGLKEGKSYPLHLGNKPLTEGTLQTWNTGFLNLILSIKWLCDLTRLIETSVDSIPRLLCVRVCR